MVSELDNKNNDVIGIPQTGSLKVMAQVATELWLNSNR